MSSEEKTSGANRKNDITADELLVLLNKSVEKNLPKGDSSSQKQGNSVSGNVEGGLSIDDSVYRAAEDKLHRADALTVTDDSDLDVDELVEKFINQPRRDRETNEEIIEAEVAQEANEEAPTMLSAEIPAQAEEMSDEVSVEEFVLKEQDEESDFESADVDGNSEEDSSDIELISEEADSAEILSESSEVPCEEKGPDEAISSEEKEISNEEMTEEDVFSVEDTRKTAEFDISLLKKMTEDGDSGIDRLVDEAFAQSETEVFSTVVGDENTDIPAICEDEPKVYGEGSADEIDQTDLNLMLAFGMDEELKETVGEDKAVEIEDDIIKKHEETVQMQSVAKIVEFTSRDQIEEILSSYKSKYYTLIIRIAAALALIAGIFLVENFSMLGLSMPSFMRPESYPMVYAMVDLQLVVLCGALAIRQIINGVKSIIALKPSIESITAFAVIISVLYTFAAAITAPVDGFALYNLPVAFAVLLSLVYEFLNVRREVFSFNVVSSRKKKFVVTPVSDATESLEREIFRDYVPAESKIIRVGKADFVDGFFARCENSPAFKPIIGIMLPIVVILSVLFMILAFIKTGSVYRAFTMGFVTTAVTMPLTSFVIYSYPFYKASKDAFDCGSAIVGEASLAEYSDSSVISFEDKEVFPSGGVKVTSIKVYGNNRIDEIIYSLASAFIKVGGPLSDVFNQATYDLGHSEDVELVEVDDDGFTVTVDDVLVYIGKSSYMEKKDYAPPFDAEGRRQEQNGNIGVLYVAYAGQLAAKVYIQYTIDSEFEAILSQLYKTGLCVGIKSFDPNIDDLLLAKKIKAMKYPAKVIRAKTVEDIPHGVERCDSGIVSRHSVKSLLKTVAGCERVSRVIKTGFIVKGLAMFIGIVVMIFIHAFADKTVIPSLYLTLYQLFWTVPVFLISRFLV